MVNLIIFYQKKPSKLFPESPLHNTVSGNSIPLTIKTARSKSGSLAE
jgi:hypothetical protein